METMRERALPGVGSPLRVFPHDERGADVRALLPTMEPVEQLADALRVDLSGPKTASDCVCFPWHSGPLNRCSSTLSP
jgi:hypothetical protein